MSLAMHSGQNTTDETTNVVRFRQARPQAHSRRDQKHLMEAIYSAGSLPVEADDRATKVMAARLQLFGFAVIDEILPDGKARRLRSSESILASSGRPWRVSKPSTGRKGIGVADAAGRVVQSRSDATPHAGLPK
jgi:hypothetical protein